MDVLLYLLGGCPALLALFINTAAQCRDPANPIASYCKAHKLRVRALIRAHLGKPYDADDSLLDAICLLKEGAMVSAYVNHDPQEAQRDSHFRKEQVESGKKLGG